MLRSLAADTHCIGVVIEPILNSLQNGLVLPSRDASLAASRALGLERTALASGRPITAQCLTILLGCEAVGELFAGRAAIDVLSCNIDEVLLAEAACGFCS